jgi:hypothetical protein
VDQQVLGDEAVERVEIGADDRLDRLYGRAAREDREAREALLLGIAEQVVAPLDGRPQRPLAGGRVAGTGAQRAQRRVEARGDLARRKQPAAGGGQLDGQWQPVDPPTGQRASLPRGAAGAAAR